ncbi:hypothetical protein RRF57_013253 [Xylaria bambusicola]|uniref:Uncharacterized protein n=1 Tax=Xylaria bambusicola TaxID=326684 RepID=A0AAN7ZFD6_9PEZI
MAMKKRLIQETQHRKIHMVPPTMEYRLNASRGWLSFFVYKDRIETLQKSAAVGRSRATLRVPQLVRIDYSKPLKVGKLQVHQQRTPPRASKRPSINPFTIIKQP